MTEIDRASVTFAQAEGLEALPSQMARSAISRELRAKLWRVLYSHLNPACMDLISGRRSGWLSILQDAHVELYHQRIDKFQLNGSVDRIGGMVDRSQYQHVYGWIQFVIRHPNCPSQLASQLQDVLTSSRAAFRIEGKTLWPLSTEEEERAIREALTNLANPKFDGAQTHLKNAANKLTAGEFAESVRESISAVESVARVLEPSGELSKALAGLEKRTKLHPALRKDFLPSTGIQAISKGSDTPCSMKARLTSTRLMRYFLLEHAHRSSLI